MIKPGPRRPQKPAWEFAGDLISDLQRLIAALESRKIMLSEVLVGPIGLSYYSVTVTPRLMRACRGFQEQQTHPEGDPRV
jgi:hypothetical protein